MHVFHNHPRPSVVPVAHASALPSCTFPSTKDGSVSIAVSPSPDLFVCTPGFFHVAAVCPCLRRSPNSTAVKKTLDIPLSEYPGKLRWRTLARTGSWVEPWFSARELVTSLSVRSHGDQFVSTVLRGALCDAIVTYVRPHLLRRTVEKWPFILFEYLELNVDEQNPVIFLLRRYAHCGGGFVGHRDWICAQRWECVIAIACYLSVLLTEDFPGRTAFDLKELLGSSFHFGTEQVLFLKTVK